VATRYIGGKSRGVPVGLASGDWLARLGAREGNEMKFRKKPVEVEAEQWTGDNWEEIKRFAGDAVVLITDTRQIEICTLEGTMTANVADWIIRGVQGEFYPCKPAIFKATYEAAE